MDLSKQALFCTPKSWQEIEDYIMGMPKECRAEAIIACGMTWNLACEASKAIVNAENAMRQVEAAKNAMRQVEAAKNAMRQAEGTLNATHMVAEDRS